MDRTVAEIGHEEIPTTVESQIFGETHSTRRISKDAQIDSGRGELMDAVEAVIVSDKDITVAADSQAAELSSSRSRDSGKRAQIDADRGEFMNCVVSVIGNKEIPIAVESQAVGIAQSSGSEGAQIDSGRGELMNSVIAYIGDEQVLSRRIMSRNQIGGQRSQKKQGVAIVHGIRNSSPVKDCITNTDNEMCLTKRRSGPTYGLTSRLCEPVERT